MVELKALKHFLAVADAGGFRRASAQTKVFQSVLSRTVRDLEDQLGVSLFERHRDGVRLTNAGRRFLRDLRGVLAALERATSSVRAAGTADEGRISLGVACSISAGYLNELLRVWLAKRPIVSLTIRDGSVHELVAAVIQRDLDVTITTGTVTPPGCDMEHLWTEQIYFVTADTNPLCQRTTLTPSDIAGERFIVSQGNFGLEIRDFLIKNFSDLGNSPSVEVFDVGREVLFSMVGLGFGSTTGTAVDIGPTYPNVSYRPIKGFRIPCNAVWSVSNDNPALRRFLSEARMLSRRWDPRGHSAPQGGARLARQPPFAEREGGVRDAQRGGRACGT